MAGRVSLRADELDAADPLAHFRDRFEHEPGGPLYVDGNSLGRLPKAARERVGAVLDAWSERLVRGWDEWIELPERIGDLLAVHVLGARPGEVVACDSTTVNLYKLAAAVLADEAGPLVVLGDDFPTDRYVLQGLAARFGVELRVTDRGGLRDASRDARLTVLSRVDYRSGEVLPLDAAHGLVLWDLSHAAGAVEVDLERTGVQLAVGCSYKYLNGGPGAPAWVYVRRELQDRLRSPIQGWFGQRDQFAMGDEYEPADGVGRFHAGTPPIVALAAVEAGVDLVAEAGIAAIAAKHRALTGFAIELADEWLTPLGFTVATPRDAERRGGHLALRHADAWPINRALIERAAVVPDFRHPDVIRFAFPALYTRFADVHEAIRRTRDLVAAGEHLLVDAAPRRVT